MNTTTETKCPTDWRGWKITDEQAAAIRNGDISARTAFYLDNLERIRKMARNYIYRRKYTPNGGEFNADDCISGVYLDIPLFDFANGASLSRSVNRSFYYSIYGGWLYVSENNRKLFDKIYQGERLYILDQPAHYITRSGETSDSDKLLIDKLTCAPDVASVIFARDILTAEMLEPVAGKYLSKQENLLFVDLLNGYEKHHICDRLGVKNVSKQYDRMCAKLRANYAEILPALSAMGVELPRYAMQAPDDYEKAVKKTQARKGAYSAMTAEQKAKSVERCRAWRAAKKAAALAAMQQPTTQATATL